MNEDARPGWPSLVAVRLVWVAVAAGVVVLSLLPGHSRVMEAIEYLPLNDKVEHMLAYAALAFLPSLREERSKLALFLGLAAALGVFLEFGQNYSPDRTFDLHDMLADGGGLAGGLVAGLPLRRTKGTQRQPSKAKFKEDGGINRKGS